MKKGFNSHTIFFGGGIPLWPPFHCFCTSICDFYVPRIANLLSPQNLAEVLFLIFQERLLVPREIEKNTEAKCCRANKVHYGQRESRK